MPQVDVGPNEPLDRALRRFKKKIEREGILKAVSAKKHYEKPSVVKRRQARAAAKAMRKKVV
ncbi:MAG: 30S ribosomal protein S21 [Candidatus Omnitrophica bacterium]|nr:30S ribosomal protein S21 [Candidatus Omnitrophota bacterium]